MLRKFLGSLKITPQKGLLTEVIAKHRLKVIAPYVRGSILDLGCGISRIVDFLSIDQVYIGVDDSHVVLEWMMQNRPQYRYLQVDLDNDPLCLNRCFDTILMLAVVEHLRHPLKVFSEISTHLERDGNLLITTPTPLGGIVHQYGAQLGLFASQAAKEHETIFDYKTLRDMLEASDLKILQYRNFLYCGNQLFICSRNSDEPVS
jgi:SAM-dependent methyltransferase